MSDSQPRIFTRREIIELWLTQPPQALDTLCCPFCRDLLTLESHRYPRVNSMTNDDVERLACCGCGKVYTLEGKEVSQGFYSTSLEAFPGKEYRR